MVSFLSLSLSLSFSISLFLYLSLSLSFSYVDMSKSEGGITEGSLKSSLRSLRRKGRILRRKGGNGGKSYMLAGIHFIFSLSIFSLSLSLSLSLSHTHTHTLSFMENKDAEKSGASSLVPSYEKEERKEDLLVRLKRESTETLRRQLQASLTVLSFDPTQETIDLVEKILHYEYVCV